MIQKRSCSLSTKVNWHFYGMVKIRLVMKNVNILTINESLLKNGIKILPTIYQKLKFPGKVISFGFN